MEGKAQFLEEKHSQQPKMMKLERKENPQPEMTMPTSLQMEEYQRHEKITEFN